MCISGRTILLPATVKHRSANLRPTHNHTQTTRNHTQTTRKSPPRARGTRIRRSREHHWLTRDARGFSDSCGLFRPRAVEEFPPSQPSPASGKGVLTLRFTHAHGCAGAFRHGVCMRLSARSMPARVCARSSEAHCLRSFARSQPAIAWRTSSIELGCMLKLVKPSASSSAA